MISNTKKKYKVREILDYDYYTREMPYLKRTLFLSRLPVLKHNGKFLLFLQRKMLINLAKFQHFISKYKGASRGKKYSDQRFILANYQILRIIKNIADGIAWRNTGFNRAIMRAFSENDSPGFLNEHDIEKAMSIKNRYGQVIIINDLTDCCRISDFVLVTKDNHKILLEAKGKEKIKLNDVLDIYKKFKEKVLKNKQRPRNQDLRQAIAQNMIIQEKIDVPIFAENGKLKESFSVDIINVDIKIKNYLPVIKKLIKQANKEGYAIGLLEEGYFVSVKAHDTISSNSEKDGAIDLIKKKEKIEEQAPDWVKQKKNSVIKISNYLSFGQEKGQFARNVIPYSLLPLSTKDCIRIMSGHLEITCHFELDIVEKKFKEKGWCVRNTELLSELKAGKIPKIQQRIENGRVMFSREPDYCLYKISKELKGGIYEASICLTQVLNLLLSFYKTDFLVETFEFLVNREDKSVNKRHKIILNYTQEKNVLK